MWKQCKVAGCAGLTRDKYCEAHAHLEQKEKQERQAHYNAKIRDPDRQKFYESPAWRRLRQIKLGQMPLCEICYAEGRITKASLVDHIQEISDGGAPLDMENLMSVCHICHNKKTAQERKKRNNGGNYND
jgi:5-methylcytosine-specific restriction protein A